MHLHLYLVSVPWDFSLYVRGEQVTKYQETPLGNPSFRVYYQCHANVINVCIAKTEYQNKELGN